MRKLTILLFFILFSVASLFAVEMTLNGIYQGKNLFVSNPFLDNDEYCVTEVTVNDIEIDDVIASSAFEISLDKMALELGDPITVVISHHDNCAPRIINPEILKPLSTYQLTSMTLDEHLLRFKTTKESSKLKFFVQAYRWGRWVSVDELDGKGGPDDNVYDVAVCPHAGKNTYRIKQYDHLSRINLSDEYEFNVDMKPVKMKSNESVNNNVKFSDVTLFELYNQYGERVRFGIGEKIDVSELPIGYYFLSYDKTDIRIRKK